MTRFVGLDVSQKLMRTEWFWPVHVKSLDAHRARALLGARTQLVAMTNLAVEPETRATVSSNITVIAVG